MSSYRKHTRSLLLGATALVGSLALNATPAGAQQRQYDFDVPPQPLEAALQTFARQAQQQVIFADTDMRGVTSPRLSGSYSADEALALLIAGTGLEVRRTASGVLKIAADQGPQGGSAGGDVDALIVTAQKREENIQDVPIAISAFSQEDLTRSQVAGGPDLITQVPNMTFTKTNFSSYSIQLRGIGTQAISATTDPAVAVAFNNTPFIRNRFFEQEFYDLQRVEVLRGPQGTLYGRNATAGVVNIISAKPKFIAEVKASADVSNFNSTRVEGMVNIPLVEDVVALRVAGAWTKREGYSTNALTGEQIDGRDLWSTRVSLRVTPSDAIDVNLIWEHFQEDDDRLRSGKQLCKKDVVSQVGNATVTNYYSSLPNIGQRDAQWANVQAVLSQGCKRNSLYAQDSFQRPVGLMLPYYSPLGAIGLPVARTDPYVNVTTSSDPAVVSATNDQIEDLRAIELTVDPDYRANSDLGELQISFDLPGNLTLQSETAYSVDEVYSLEDFNRFNTAPGAWLQTNARPGVLENGVFCDPQLGCSDRLVAVDISTAQASQFSQELRLSSDFDGAFNFSVGANFLRADSEDKYYVFINSISLAAAADFISALSTPYIGGISDNHGCLLNGYGPGDPNGTYAVTQCSYIEPNSIGAIQDTGHNYFLSKNPYKLISYAVFGEAYYNITENLKLTAGLRWTVDKKEAPRVPTWVLISQSVGYPVAEVIEQEWREPTGRLTLDWKPDLSFTDETLLYASYAHGYKAGGANPPGFVRSYYGDQTTARLATMRSATRPLTFDPEFVDAFELGAKNTLADGRLTLNLAAFYYDYTGYQVSEIVDRSAFNRNFDATVWGVELEADWRPLENLRLGLKGGYEKTRIADGEEAIDLMDRTAGRDDWVVSRPFPTFASSCVLPTFLFAHDGPDVGGGTPGLYNVGSLGGGGPTGCELAYFGGVDPVTQLPYVLNPTGADGSLSYSWFPGTYPGWDPTIDYGNNGGEGFTKPLGGNELPNAPNLTATITGDYTIPLPNDWLATIHTDLHWQSESWWRVFNDHEYDKLDEYFTMNLAAIFMNEEAGWNVMAYIKNVTDVTAITGAFLNSDDTGLTTNVFLTEPRLYGVRVTKNFTGGSLLGSFGERHEGPYPFTLELGGMAQRHDAPTEALQTAFTQQFAAPLDVFDDAQEADHDWGQGGNGKLTYRPAGGTWQLSATIRQGEANGHAHPVAQFETPTVCALAGSPFEFACPIRFGEPGYNSTIGRLTELSATNWADASAIDREDQQIIDLTVGRELTINPLGRSVVSAGLRFAKLESSTDGRLLGVPDWNLPAAGFFFPGVPATHTEYDISFAAQRQFEGAGLVVAWDASYPLLDGGEAGRVDLDWSITGGVLFGDRETSASVVQTANRFNTTALALGEVQKVTPVPIPVASPAPIDLSRSDSVTVPTAAVSLGLSYEVDRFSIGAGYRWERYFDAIDGGYTAEQSFDRTIDGPYFKIAVGFGG